MIYRCSNCTRNFIEYAVKVTRACSCGSWRFWFTHLTSEPPFSHEVLIDCETDKVLSPDPCDAIFPRGGEKEE